MIQEVLDQIIQEKCDGTAGSASNHAMDGCGHAGDRMPTQGGSLAEHFALAS